MVNQELLDYIKQQLTQNVGIEEIRGSLKANGWQDSDLDEAFKAISPHVVSPQPIPVITPVTPITASPVIETKTTPQSSVASQGVGVALLPASTIFGQALSIYKARFWTFAGIMIIPTGMVLALAILMTGGVLGLYLLFAKVASGGILLAFVLALFAALIILIVQAWAQVALLYAVKHSGEGMGIVQAYKTSWRKIGSYYWVAMLVGLITFGGLFLLIVPGVIFAVLFSLSLFILVDEDLRGMNALMKSRDYVKGHWGSMLWRTIFVGVPAFLISLLLNYLFSYFQVPYGVPIVKLISGLFITPLVVTFLFLVYQNFKTVKESSVSAPSVNNRTMYVWIGILGLAFPFLLGFLLFTFRSTGVRGISNDAVSQAQLRAQLSQIQGALMVYHNEYNTYPTKLEDLYPKYIYTPPVDSKTQQPFLYQVDQDGKNYLVCAVQKSSADKCVTANSTY